MREIQSVKCDLEVQKYAQQVAHLQKVIDDNMFQWECCARGGNATENGGCDISIMKKVTVFCTIV